MRYALFVMLLACGDKEEDTAVLEEEAVEEVEDSGEGSEETEESEGEE